MKHVRISWFLLLFIQCGCMVNVVKSTLDSRQIDVFGVVLYSSSDYQSIGGVKGVDEPCLRGYDRSFDALDIVIGYNRDGKIRKITTRNSQNSIFGVHPGEAVDTAMVKIRGAGFVEDGSAYHFRKDSLELSVLIDSSGRLFGLTLEDKPLKK